MALKEITGSNAVSFGEGDIGKTLEGYYMGGRRTTTKYGEKTIHILRDRDGKDHELWGSAQIDRKLGACTLRAWTRIEYAGKASTGRGGQTMHTVKVLSDDDDITPEQSGLWQIPA